MNSHYFLRILRSGLRLRSAKFNRSKRLRLSAEISHHPVLRTELSFTAKKRAKPETYCVPQFTSAIRSRYCVPYREATGKRPREKQWSKKSRWKISLYLLMNWYWACIVKLHTPILVIARAYFLSLWWFVLFRHLFYVLFPSNWRELKLHSILLAETFWKGWKGFVKIMTMNRSRVNWEDIVKTECLFSNIFMGKWEKFWILSQIDFDEHEWATGCHSPRALWAISGSFNAIHLMRGKYRFQI